MKLSKVDFKQNQQLSLQLGFLSSTLGFINVSYVAKVSHPGGAGHWRGSQDKDGVEQGVCPAALTTEGVQTVVKLHL